MNGLRVEPRSPDLQAALEIRGLSIVYPEIEY